jgi:hypothetical protein
VRIRKLVRSAAVCASLLGDLELRSLSKFVLSFALGFLVAGRSEAMTINLGDVVAGGNGLGTPLPGNEGKIGIDTSTGKFINAQYRNYLTADSYTLASNSPFVDGVFVLNPQNVQINSSGIKYTVMDKDFGGVTFDYILNNREPGGFLPLTINGQVFDSGIGIHAPAGITFNLNVIDSYHGTHYNYFSSLFGRQSGVSAGKIRGYVLLSDDAGVIGSYISNKTDYDDVVTDFQVPIPSNAKYLTLMVGMGDGIMQNDHGGFGNAILSTIPEPSTLALLLTVAVFLWWKERKKWGKMG